MRVDAKEPHAVLRPEVSADGGLDAGLEQPHDEVATQRLSLSAEQREVRGDGFTAREGIAKLGLAPWCVL